MPLLLLQFLLFFHSASGPVQTTSTLPKFEDYRVTEHFAGKNAKPVLVTKDDRQFRTRLTEGAREKVNFAGHYVLTVWGCGGGCLSGAVIDAKTGKVSWLPFSICCWPEDVEKPIGFRLDSRLVVFTGSRNEEGQGIYYYKFDGDRFTLLKAIEKKP